MDSSFFFRSREPLQQIETLKVLFFISLFFQTPFEHLLTIKYCKTPSVYTVIGKRKEAQNSRIAQIPKSFLLVFEQLQLSCDFLNSRIIILSVCTLIGCRLDRNNIRRNYIK